MSGVRYMTGSRDSPLHIWKCTIATERVLISVFYVIIAGKEMCGHVLFNWPGKKILLSLKGGKTK